MPIRSFPEPAVPADLLAQVRELQREAWPAHDFPADEPVHDPALSPLTMLLLDGESVVAALDVLSKEIVHGGRRFRAAGLSTVVTRKAVRGRGHGRLLVRAARRAIAASGSDVGLFTCDEALQGFYESAGWRHVPGAVLVGGTPEAPFPSDQPGFGKVTMGDFFSAAGVEWQLSFHHARVALHPGEIDRLW